MREGGVEGVRRCAGGVLLLTFSGLLIDTFSLLRFNV